VKTKDAKKHCGLHKETQQSNIIQKNISHLKNMQERFTDNWPKHSIFSYFPL